MVITRDLYGIPLSAFQSRLKGKPYKDSSVFFELGMLVAGVVILPVAIVHGFLRGLIGLPNTRFDTTTAD